MFRNHLKIAIRNLFSNKIFTIINVAGLSIGMAAALIIFIWVQNELSFDGYHKNADQIYRIISHWHGEEGAIINIAAIPLAMKELAEAEIPEIEEMYVVRPAFGSPLVSIGNDKVLEEKEMAYISKSWLNGFDYEVIEGSIEDFNNNKYSIALTKAQTVKYFGDEDGRLGQAVRIFGKDFVLRLILADNPVNSSFQYKAFLPLDAVWSNPAEYQEDYENSNYNYLTFFKASENIDQEQIADKLSEILVRVDADDDYKSSSVFPLKDMRFKEGLNSDYLKHQSRSAVYVFGLIAIILLLTAGLNYINLSTAMISKKIKEIGIKKVIGADFKHIFTQTLLETSLINFLAFGIAFVILLFTLPLLNQYIGYDLPLELNKVTIWMVLGGTFVISILVAGIYPAILFSGFQPLRLIRGDKSPQGNGVSLRKALVIAQFVGVVILLISTGIIYQQLNYIQTKDVGYNRSHVVNIQPNLFRGDSIGRNFERFTLFSEALRQVQDIESVALVENPISDITNQNRGSFEWEGKPSDYSVIVTQITADENLTSVFDLEIEDGRWFSNELGMDKSNYIVNETLVKQFNIPEPVVGRPAKFHKGEGRIIGVVKDFNFASMHKAIEPLVISHNSGFGRSILTRVNSKNAQNALNQAEKTFNTFLPEITFKYDFLDDTYQKMHGEEIKMGQLFQAFAGLLIFIACLGLLGLAIFASEHRMKEISVRKVLGASTASIIGLLSKDFLKLVAIAFLVAVPVAWYGMNQWLTNFAYRVEIQWWVFALAGLLVIGIAFLTVGFQSLKTALANPIDALRQE